MSTSEGPCPCEVAWPTQNSDRFCGYCGKSLVNYSLSWVDPPAIYLDDTSKKNLQARIRNTGLSDVELIDLVSSQPEAVTIEYNRPTTPIKPNREHPFEVVIYPTLLEKKEIIIEAVVGPDLPQRTLSAGIPLSPPEFRLYPETTEKNPQIVKFADPNEVFTLPLCLDVFSGILILEDVQCQEKGIEVHHFTKNSPLTGRYKNAVTLRITPNQTGHKATINLSLFFKVRNRKTGTLTHSIKLQQGPILKVGMENEFTIFREKQKIIDLVLSNIGESPLTIQALNINQGDNPFVSCHAHLPITLESEKQKVVKLKIDGTILAEDCHEFQILFDSDCSKQSKKKIRVNFNVCSMPEYPFPLAIDYGTTNSCCAYFDRLKNDFILTTLYEEEKKNGILEFATIPSSIVYYPQPYTKKVDVGHLANDKIATRLDEFHFSSVKRWLGYRWDRKFPNSQQLQPPDVVSDFIRFMIDCAEDKLGHKIKRCVLTHPTMFYPRQKEDLRQALTACGIEKDHILLIDEATAAALGDIYKRKRSGVGLEEKYRLLVYDFGGGTTDIVLSEVDTTNGKMNIRTISWGGNLKFGGDDVTQLLVDHIVSKILELCRDKLQLREDQELTIPYLKKYGKAQNQTESKQKMTLNGLELYTIAEQAKIALSTKDSIEIIPGLILIKLGNEFETIKKWIDTNIFVKIIRTDLEDLIRDALKANIDKIEGMIQETGGTPPSLIVLAGQSSKMPLVKLTLEQFCKQRGYPGVDIKLAEQPKECVALGAAQFGMSQVVIGSGYIPTIPDFSNRTHSRFGISEFFDGQMQFREIVSKGKIIPHESKGQIEYLLPQSREIFVEVREHFGLGNDLDPQVAPPIGEYFFRFDKNINIADNTRATLELTVFPDESVKLVAKAGGQIIDGDVKREEPPFRDQLS